MVNCALDSTERKREQLVFISIYAILADRKSFIRVNEHRSGKMQDNNKQ